MRADVRLGPAIVSQARRNKLKVITVDDCFIGPDGTFMADVPYLGMSASKIGESVGTSLHDEMTRRKWPIAETGACVVTFEELDTAGSERMARSPRSEQPGFRRTESTKRRRRRPTCRAASTRANFADPTTGDKALARLCAKRHGRARSSSSDGGAGICREGCHRNWHQWYRLHRRTPQATADRILWFDSGRRPVKVFGPVK